MSNRFLVPGVSLAAGVLLVVGVGGTASAGQGFTVTKSTGDYFSKRYEVRIEAERPAPAWTRMLSIKGRGVREKVDVRPGYWSQTIKKRLTPGAYRLRYIETNPATTTGRAWVPSECAWTPTAQTGWEVTRQVDTYLMVDGQRRRTTTGSLTCGEGVWTYRGTYQYAEYQTHPYWYPADEWEMDYGKSESWRDFQYDGQVTLSRVGGGSKTVTIGERTIQVRRVNGAWVSKREARAISIGMPMARVHEIFGTAGRSGLNSAGFSVRHYDDWITIGYSNGRVQSIQRY